MVVYLCPFDVCISNVFFYVLVRICDFMHVLVSAHYVPFVALEIINGKLIMVVMVQR